MIETVVKLWLENSNFLEKLKKYYDFHNNIDEKFQYGVRYIRNELDRIGRVCTDTDEADTYFVDNGMEFVNVRFGEIFRKN